MNEPRTLECPQCRTRMNQRERNDVTIDYCPDCGGVWLDPGELDAIAGSRGKRRHSSHRHHHDEDEEGEEGEAGEEESGGLLGFVEDALGGGGEGEDGGGWGGDGGGGDGGGGGGAE